MSTHANYIKSLAALVQEPPPDLASEQLSAIQALLERRERAERDIASIDLFATQRELFDLTWSGDYDELSRDELKRACRLAHQRGTFFALLRDIRMTSFTLLALYYLVEGLRKKEIAERMSGSRWAERHQVHTRWAWCSAQQRADGTREIFSRIYMCEVGSREQRSKIDREFYALLHFLPHYQRRSRENLVLDSYRGDTSDSPDFELVDDRGQRVGLEVTDAVRGERWYPEEISGERVLARLQAEFASDCLTLGILSRPSWSTLEGKIEEVVRWLHDVHEGNVSREPYFGNYRNSELELAVSLTHNETSLRVFCMGDGGGLGSVGNADDRRVAEAFATRIEKKCKGPRPRLRPCILLVYDDVGVPVGEDYERVVELLHERIDWISGSNFSQIWLMDDQKCQRVFPR